MQGFCIVLGIYGDCQNAETGCGPSDAQGNFPPVGNEDFAYFLRSPGQFFLPPLSYKSIAELSTHQGLPVTVKS